MFICTCGCSKNPCNSAFVYDSKGNTIAEIPKDKVPYLKNEFSWLCAGAGLQKLNKQIKENSK